MAHQQLDGRRGGQGPGQGGRRGAERSGHGRRDAVGRGQTGELDEPRAVREIGVQRGGDLHGQPGLARASGSDQRDEAAPAHRVPQVLQLDAATDEARQALPEVAVRAGRRAGHRGRAGDRVQRRIVAEHEGLELAQRRAGIDAQLLDQPLPAVGVGAQGLGLTPAPVEREHEQLQQPLAQRMPAHPRLQLAHELHVPTQF